jgi:hypothetical protein
MTEAATTLSLAEVAGLLDRDALARVEAMRGRELYIPYPEAVCGSRLAQLIGPAAAERLALSFPDRLLKVPF